MSKQENSGNYNYGFLFSGLSLGILAILELKYSYDLNILKRLKRDLQTPTTIDPQNEGKPVYASGLLTLSSPITLVDPLLDVQQVGVKLMRQIQMYQWEEGKDLAYTTNWKSEAINSKKFPKNKKNPDWKFFSKEFLSPEPYLVSPFKLGKNVIPYLKSIWGINPDTQQEKASKDIKNRGYNVYKDSQYFYLSRLNIKGNLYKPKPGDYRIKYDYIPSEIYLSIVGEQRSDKIVPYRGKIFMVKEGKITPEEMIENYEIREQHYIWLTRFICGLGVFGGAYFGFKG